MLGRYQFQHTLHLVIKPNFVYIRGCAHWFTSMILSFSFGGIGEDFFKGCMICGRSIFKRLERSDFRKRLP
jgi:hypothetical protein